MFAITLYLHVCSKNQLNVVSQYCVDFNLKLKNYILFYLFIMKLDVARKCGAEVVLNPTKCDVIVEVKKLSDGYGCDVYIEASGSPVSVTQG